MTGNVEVDKQVKERYDKAAKKSAFKQQSNTKVDQDGFPYFNSYNLKPGKLWIAAVPPLL